MEDGYHEYAGVGFSVSVRREDDKVSISFHRDTDLLARIETTRGGAMGLVQKILEAL